MISADSSFRRFLIVSCLVATAFGCSTGGRVMDGPSACSMLDSLYDHGGFELPFAFRGKATVDAEQRRFRGKVNVNVSESGNIVFEFTSTILFGSRREDFVFAVAADTVRILDRERGYYFEGQEADDYLNEALRLDFGLGEALRLALGGRLPCEGMQGVRVRSGSGGEIKVTGEVARSSFSVVFSADERRLAEFRWPMLDGRRVRDYLVVRYDWAKDRSGTSSLREVVIWLEDREWRCKITAATI